MKFLLALLLTAWTAQAACIPPPNTYDWEAERWQTNIVANSGTLSASSYRAGTYYMQQVKWWGVRPQLGRVNLFLGGDTNAMQCPIINDWSGGGVINDDLIAFVAGDYTEATGLTGNGTTKYLRCSKGSGLNLSSFTVLTNLHLAAYVRTSSDEASYLMGGITGGVSIFANLVSYSGQTYIQIGATSANAADSGGTGLVLATRGSTTRAITWRNATAIITNTASDTAALGGVAVMVHAINNNGAVGSFTSRTLSYYAYGYHIPDPMVSPYNVAVQNVQQALGRKMP